MKWGYNDGNKNGKRTAELKFKDGSQIDKNLVREVTSIKDDKLIQGVQGINDIVKQWRHNIEQWRDKSWFNRPIKDLFSDNK